MTSCDAFYRDRGECMFCEMLRQELETRERVALESGSFVALSPFAARFPFELWVLPKEHSPHFGRLGEDLVPEFAAFVQQTLARLEVCLQDPPYNFAIHTAPTTGTDVGHFHWHLELIPRVTEVAGFEWGTGFYINPMEPERAAEHLRRVPQTQVEAKVAPMSVGTRAGS